MLRIVFERSLLEKNRETYLAFKNLHEYNNRFLNMINYFIILKAFALLSFKQLILFAKLFIRNITPALYYG